LVAGSGRRGAYFFFAAFFAVFFLAAFLAGIVFVPLSVGVIRRSAP